MFFINFMLFLIDTPFKVLDIKKRGFQMKKMEKKYIPLAQFFETCTDNTFTLTYDEIQNIMGHELPNAAFLNSSWWKKTKAPSTHYFAWTNSNYQVIHVLKSHSDSCISVVGWSRICGSGSWSCCFCLSCRGCFPDWSG